MKPNPPGGQPGARAGDGAGLVEEYERLLDRLAMLAQSFGGARDLVSIFRLLGDFAEASTACNGIFISLYDPGREVRIPAYARSEGEEADVAALPPMPMSGSPHSRAVSTGQVVIEDDFQASVVGMPIVNIAMDKDPRIVRSSLCVPMAVMGRVIG